MEQYNTSRRGDPHKAARKGRRSESNNCRTDSKTSEKREGVVIEMLVQVLRFLFVVDEAMAWVTRAGLGVLSIVVVACVAIWKGRRPKR